MGSNCVFTGHLLDKRCYPFIDSIPKEEQAHEKMLKKLALVTLALALMLSGD